MGSFSLGLQQQLVQHKWLQEGLRCLLKVILAAVLQPHWG